MTSRPTLAPEESLGNAAADALCFLEATALARHVADGDMTAEAVLEAHLAQIARLNPLVNAIPTLVPDQARDSARALDAARRRGIVQGPLHGLPVAIKDLVQTRGIRTTFGSRIYEQFVPQVDEVLVERLRGAGAVIVGKTNTPEFGAGSQTFNAVFGRTRNPYDLERTCGGSSGGAAVALACGMLPLADGSDLGGSLRNPAAFCNVVGMRPSPGRVPTWPRRLGWSPLAVQGPMGRTVGDVALLLSVLAGPDDRSPIALDDPGHGFRAPLSRKFKGVRVAWSPGLERYPLDPALRRVLETARPVLAGLGCKVVDGAPDFSDAEQCFQVLRAYKFALAHADELRRHRDKMKDTVIWNIEQGLKLDGLSVARAEEKRTALYHRVREFMQTHEFLVLATTQVTPFPIEQEYVTEIDGQKLETYIDWMGVCYAITLTGLPAISVPCGFTPAGLPVGLQIVGRHRQDFAVLQLAHAFEQATGHGRRRPPIAGAA
ncbi:MAG: amidase [Candidatus Lambdaproteobacteria bacterium]|nr:amidase [Candidatus Lambdaproteobacteria bacterium]